MSLVVRVALVEEHPLLGPALAAAVTEAPGVLLVGHAAAGGDALGLLDETRPDVVVLSARLRDVACADLCGTISDRFPGLRTVVLSESADAVTLLAAVEAGAHGFVTAEADLDELVATVQRVHAGETVVPPAMLGSLLRGLIERGRRNRRATELAQRLTRREREVLELLVEGCDHDAIADILVISPQTARTHIQNLLTKLEVHSRLEAAAFALEHGLVDRIANRSAR